MCAERLLIQRNRGAGEGQQLQTVHAHPSDVRLTLGGR